MSRPNTWNIRNLPNDKSGAVIIDQSGYILLVLQDNKTYSLPKGSIQHEETAYSAAIREVSEETGFDISPYEPFELIEQILYGTATYYMFVIKIPLSSNDIPLIKSKETIGFLWLNPLKIKDEFFRTNKLNKLTYTILMKYGNKSAKKNTTMRVSQNRKNINSLKARKFYKNGLPRRNNTTVRKN